MCIKDINQNNEKENLTMLTDTDIDTLYNYYIKHYDSNITKLIFISMPLRNLFPKKSLEDILLLSYGKNIEHFTTGYNYDKIIVLLLCLLLIVFIIYIRYYG